MHTGAAIIIGYTLDMLLGDPYFLPHPIRAIGSLISFLEKKLRKANQDNRQKRRNGTLLVLLVLLFTAVPAFFVLFLAYRLHPLAGIITEAIMDYYILATKCLRTESMKVYTALENKNLEEARSAVSMIVGRDTESLDEKGIIRATVETVAENTSDGSIAPLLYLLFGGPVPGFLYKAVNTMDSMIGYKNDNYLFFGRTAAKLDDVLNFIPSRLAAVAMIAAAFLIGENGKDAFFIWRRDRKNHASPNSAQTEAVCAGALGVALAGDASYFGKTVHKPIIGEAQREIEAKDIKKACLLLYVSAGIILVTGLCLRFLLMEGYHVFF